MNTQEQDKLPELNNALQSYEEEYLNQLIISNNNHCGKNYELRLDLDKGMTFYEINGSEFLFNHILVYDFNNDDTFFKTVVLVSPMHQTNRVHFVAEYVYKDFLLSIVNGQDNFYDSYGF